jgi:hypothetical protein
MKRSFIFAFLFLVGLVLGIHAQDKLQKLVVSRNLVQSRLDLPPDWGLALPVETDQYKFQCVFYLGDGPWPVERWTKDAVPRPRAGLLYGPRKGKKGVWEEVPLNGEHHYKYLDLNGSPRQQDWVVVKEETGTKWVTISQKNLEINLARPINYEKISGESLLAAIKAEMANSIAYAESESVKLNPRMTVYQASGFTSAIDFCRAKDPGYILCEKLLRDAGG